MLRWLIFRYFALGQEKVRVSSGSRQDSEGPEAQSIAMDRKVPNANTEQEIDMNKLANLCKTLIQAAVITLALLGAAPSQADQLSPALYAEQLERCAAEIRTEMATPGTTRLQHELTGVERTGLWYLMEIRTTAMDAADKVTDQATTRCKAHRWTQETVAEIERSVSAVARPGSRLAANG